MNETESLQLSKSDIYEILFTIFQEKPARFSPVGEQLAALALYEVLTESRRLDLVSGLPTSVRPKSVLWLVKVVAAGVWKEMRSSNKISGIAMQNVRYKLRPIYDAYNNIGDDEAARLMTDWGS